MILFPDGIKITTLEQACLSHIIPDTEASIQSSLTGKIDFCRDALIEAWRPTLFADSSVTELPADSTALVELIFAREDYKTRLEHDAAKDPPEALYKHATAKFEGTSRVGLAVRRPDRVPGAAPVTLFASGINVADIDANCVLAYNQDLGDWVIGALMGRVNRGKKRMIKQYYPIILADTDVTAMPGTEDGLIEMILARADYVRGG